MTSQETPATTPISPPSRKGYWLVVGGVLLMALIGLLLWPAFRLQVMLAHQKDQIIAIQQDLSSLKASTSQTDAAIASLRLQQTGEAERLNRVEQHTFTRNPGLARAYAALSTFDDDLDTLLLPGERSHILPSPAASPEEMHPTVWQQVIAALRQVWHQLVTVRHVEAGDEILTPGAAQLVILRLHGEVAAAKWALLHEEPGIHATALANVRHLLTHDFPKGDIAPLLQSLDALDRSKEITDTSPDLTDSR